MSRLTRQNRTMIQGALCVQVSASAVEGEVSTDQPLLTNTPLPLPEMESIVTTWFIDSWGAQISAMYDLVENDYEYMTNMYGDELLHSFTVLFTNSVWDTDYVA